MKINEICKKTKISKRNIHFYIKEGLISPRIDPQNHYYNFSEEDCTRLLLIRNLRNSDMPLSMIKSILNNPFTSGYYLNYHIKNLRNEQRHIEQTLVSLQYILDNISFFPNLSALSRISTEAAIPEKRAMAFADDYYDHHAIAVTNQVLWGAFLRDDKLTEYQEFLWAKVNRITTENPSPEYIRLGQTLYSTNSSLINILFTFNSEHLCVIENLSDGEISVYAHEKIKELEQIVHTPKYVSFWIEYYDIFFYPIAKIQASDLSSLIMELSPYYKRYVNNINKICQILYDHLQSECGKKLAEEISLCFDSKINLHHANHGELEALLNVPSMCTMFESESRRKHSDHPFVDTEASASPMID